MLFLKILKKLYKVTCFGFFGSKPAFFNGGCYPAKRRHHDTKAVGSTSKLAGLDLRTGETAISQGNPSAGLGAKYN